MASRDGSDSRSDGEHDDADRTLSNPGPDAENDNFDSSQLVKRAKTNENSAPENADRVNEARMHVMEATKSEKATDDDSRQCSSFETKIPAKSCDQRMPLLVPASPPMFVSIEEIMKTADQVKNMALCHEIAIDNNFQLQKNDPVENSFEEKVSSVVRQAFWDLLQEQLQCTPPLFEQAINLLSEIKQMLDKLFLSSSGQMKKQMDEVLDLKLIEQQAEQGVIDFQHYADFIIGIMAQLCAPARDEEINKLRQIHEVVPLFKEIFGVLDLMRLDMANFTIQQIRPTIKNQSVDYEKAKFNRLLGHLKERNEDGLQLTKNWLYTTYNNHSSKETLSPISLIHSSFLRLLNERFSPCPETIVMDELRIVNLRQEYKKLMLISSISLITYSTVGAPIASVSKLKEMFCDKLDAIFGDENIGESLLKNASLLINKEVTESMKERGYGALPEDRQHLLMGQIEQVDKPDNPIRKIINSRMDEFVLDVLAHTDRQDHQLPPGLSAVSDKFGKLCGQFVRLVNYNKAVFGQHYAAIVKSLLPIGP